MWRISLLLVGMVRYGATTAVTHRRVPIADAVNEVRDSVSAPLQVAAAARAPTITIPRRIGHAFASKPELIIAVDAWVADSTSAADTYGDHRTPLNQSLSQRTFTLSKIRRSLSVYEMTGYEDVYPR